MPHPLAAVLVFVTSAAVLVLEILASRLLAPYVGDSLQTYTAIIGVVLAGIAVGSWLGGRWADRTDPRLLLGPTVALGGVLGLASVPLATWFGEALRGGGPVSTVLVTAVAFLAPALLLSAVTPLVIKLRLHDLDETGRTVGQLSALGTAGALFGTFVTGFVLVAALPTRTIVLLVGSAMILLGVGLAWWLRRPAPSGLARTGAVAAAGVLVLALALVVRTPCDVDTPYYCARVDVDAADPGLRVLVLDSLRHSAVDVSDPTRLEFRYTQIFGAVVDTLPAGPIDVLHLGGGGLTMPRWIDATRPGSSHVVVEIDPELPRIARERLGWDDPASTRIVIGDARRELPLLSSGRFDLVVGDAFGGLAVPWHLTTREFLDVVKARMTPGGTYVLNVIDYGDQDFARAQAATLRDAFEHVAVVASPAALALREGGNIVLVASDAPIDVAGIAAGTRQGEVVATGEELAAWVGDAHALRDDFAPVDQLLTPYAG